MVFTSTWINNLKTKWLIDGKSLHGSSGLRGVPSLELKGGKMLM